jgi:hypothetical protein
LPSQGRCGLVAIALVVVTRGRLGLERKNDEAKSATAAAPPARASMGPAAASGAWEGEQHAPAKPRLNPESLQVSGCA